MFDNIVMIAFFHTSVNARSKNVKIMIFGWLWYKYANYVFINKFFIICFQIINTVLKIFILMIQ